MNIYLHELKVYRKNTLVWIGSLCAGTLFMFWMFPAFSQSAGAITELLNNYPKIIRIAFGFSAGTISTMTGFYAFVVTFFILCGAIQAMTLGISVLSRETTGKTVDFLLTRPVARGRVLTAKLLTAFTCALLTSAAYIGFSLGMAHAVADGPFSARVFTLMALTFFFEQVFFLSLGFLIGAAARRVRSVLPITLSTVFGFYLIGMTAAALERPDLYYLSPFKYFDPIEILKTASYQPSFTLAAAGIVAVSVAAAYAVYIKRDIHAA